MTDYYSLLQIPRTSEPEEIRRAIASPPEGLALDVLADAERALVDAERRENYDKALARDREIRQEFEAREAAYLRDDLPEALARALRMTEIAPEDADAWNQALSIAEASGDPTRAAEIAAEATKLHPEDPRLWHRAALASLSGAIERALREGKGEAPDFDAGLALMERAVALAPGVRMFEYEHVRLLRACGRPLIAIGTAERYILADRTVDSEDLPFLQLVFELYAELELEFGMRGVAALLGEIVEGESEHRLKVAEALLAQIEGMLGAGYGVELRHLHRIAAVGARGGSAELLEQVATLDHQIELESELPILREERGLLAEIATGFVLVELERDDEAKRYRERVDVLREGALALGAVTIRRDLDQLRERYPAVWDSFGARLETIFLGEDEEKAQ